MFTNYYLNFISAAYPNTGYTVMTSTCYKIYIKTLTFSLSANRMMKIPLFVLLGTSEVVEVWQYFGGNH